ncbi:MAG: PE-PPE domain-containing protein [Mycobacterium sp.]
MRIPAASLMATAAVGFSVATGAIGGVVTTLTAAVTLTATALIVPGTAVPDPAVIPGYMQNAVDYYIAPTTESCAVVCTPEPVPYIAQFWPFPWAGWGGLTGAKFDVSVASGVSQLTSDLVGPFNPDAQSPVVVFGYSQGATVATYEKYQLSKLSAEDQSAISFSLIGNPNRPNGGLFERLAMFGTVPILDATFGVPTPTDTGMSTVDIAFQYDGVVDFPLYPINLLADLNAAAGFWYIHGSYLAPDGRNPDGLPNGLTPAELAAAIADPANQQRLAGTDTTYVLIPTPNLPLLEPLREFGAFTHTEFITTPLIDLIQPALQVLIETGYNRALPYSTPAPFRLIPLIDPVTLTVDLVNAVGQGIRAAINDIAPPSAPAAPARVAPRSNAATARSVPAGSARSGPVQKSRAGRAAAAAAPGSSR